jgi:predicted RNA binding protein YcfA (HicA-like mRNA interferase family)
MTPPLPRNLSGRGFVKLAERMGYKFSRRSGSHIILTVETEGKYHICIPDHKELSVGTLNDIINEMVHQLNIGKKELISKLFG